MIVLGLLVACDVPADEQQRPPPAPAPAQPEAAVAPLATPAPPVADAGKPERGAPAAAPDIDLAKRKALETALKAARKHMAAKQYAQAITAYDTALAAVPDFPRGLSGRGYAKLLSGDLDGAGEDLQRALDGAPEIKLRSAVAFNLGLLAEKRGDAPGAQKWFVEAYRLRPGHETIAKLTGVEKEVACGVTRTDDPGVVYDGWLALWKAVAADVRAAGFDDDQYDFVGPEPKDEAAARERLLDDRHGPTGPWIASWSIFEKDTGEMGVCPLHHMLVVPEAGGRLRMFRAHWFDAKSWRDHGCTAQWTLDVELAPGPVLATRATVSTLGRDGADEDCDLRPDDDTCIRTVVVQWNRTTTAVFAGSPPRQVFSVEAMGADDHRNRIVELAPGKLTVEGEGCELELSIP